MAISDKVRKMLWGNAGGVCSICRKKLTNESKEKNVVNSIIGEECHIISAKPSGPRFDKDYPKNKIDSYENLILLCRNDHKTIDVQILEYSVENLKKVKTKHEKWVRDRLKNKENIGGVKLISVKPPKDLIRIEHGGDFNSVLNGACSMEYINCKISNRDEVELVGELLSILEDFDVIFSPDGGLKLQTEMEYKLTLILDSLDAIGIWVFGAKKINVLEINGQITEWAVGIIQICRKDEDKVFKLEGR